MKNNMKRIALIGAYPVLIIATYLITKASIPVNNVCNLNNGQFKITRENSYFDSNLGYNIAIDKKGVMSGIEIYNDHFSLRGIYVGEKLVNITCDLPKKENVPISPIKNLERLLDSLIGKN